MFIELVRVRRKFRLCKINITNVLITEINDIRYETMKLSSWIIKIIR